MERGSERAMEGERWRASERDGEEGEDREMEGKRAKGRCRENERESVLERGNRGRKESESQRKGDSDGWKERWATNQAVRSPLTPRQEAA